MAARNGIIKAEEADKLYSYPVLARDASKVLHGDGTWGEIPATYSHPTYTVTNSSTTLTPAFGATVTLNNDTVNELGHTTKTNKFVLTIPNAAASTTAAGLMSAADKVAVNKIAALESSLQAANTTIASLANLLSAAWTYSSDTTTGAVSFAPANGKKLITIPVAGS